MTVRVLLVDDQDLVRMGIRMALEADGAIEVVAEAGDGAEALVLARRHRPDVVLMDVRMPGTDGITATALLVAELPSIAVLVLTTFDLDDYAFGAIRAGASGFLLKNARPAELRTAVHAVAAGEAVTSPRVTRRLMELVRPGLSTAAPDPRVATLTGREREVLTLMAEGLTNSEIAEAFVVSESTVKTHVNRLLAKLGARDRVHAVIMALEHGLRRPS
jgi:DNA-binding NarL/FixJ family response regulator